MNNQKPSKWGKVGKVALILFTFLLLIAGVAYLLTDIPEASGAYKKNLEAAKYAGLAMSSEDVDRIRAVPEEDNAASLVLLAEENFKEIDKELYVLRSKEQAEDLKAGISKAFEYYTTDSKLAQVWKRLEPDFNRLEQASHRKTLVFKYDFRDPISSVTSDRGRFRHWISIIVQKAHLSEQAGDIVESRSLICTAARLATLIQSDMIFDSIYKRFSASIIIQKELAKWTRLHGADKAWRAVILEATTSLDEPFDLRPAFRIHHWVSLFITEKLVGWRNSPDPPDSELDDAGPSFGSTQNNVKWFRMIPRFGQANVSRVHEYYSKALNSYPEDLWDFAALHRHMAPLDIALQDNSLSIQVAQFSIPSFSQFDKSLARCVARTNVILQALAILESGPPKGVLPLKGHHSIDIDGKPIRMVSRSDGWIIYSIERDGVDDGGNDDPKHAKDFVVHIPMEVK